MALSARFWKRIKTFSSALDVQKIQEGLVARSICAFRINTLLSNEAEVEQYLQEAEILFTKNPAGIPNAYTIEKQHEYTLKGSKLFYDGKIYLQSLSSQLPALALGVRNGQKILDICAAPGGKTSQICGLLENTGEVVACEKFGIRFDKLCFTLKQQGCKNTTPLKVDALALYKNFEDKSFDTVLLDAPCSAEGRFDIENEKTYSFWTEKNIEEKAEYQKKLFEISWRLLKNGGELLYSTCTLAPEENECIINWALEYFSDIEIVPLAIKNELFVPAVSQWETTVFPQEIAMYGKRILPSPQTEGFFLIKIKKTSSN